MFDLDLGLDTILDCFADGYAVYFGSYYGDCLMETAEEITEDYEYARDGGDDGWLYVQSITVDESTRTVHVFIGSDE